MKKKENLNKLSFLLLLILLIGLIPSFSPLIIGNLAVGSIEKNNLKISDSWELSPILIDGDETGVGAHNWTWAVNQDWCSGLGTFSSPYIIENITINCNYGYYGIQIRDSNVYFRIQNCTIFNHVYDSDRGAIYLYDISKGKIHNNTIHSGGQGIASFLIRNVTITENIIVNTIGTVNAIDTSGYDHISIIGNTLEGGIYLNGDNNTVVGNTIWNAGEGIESYSGDYLNITGNTIYNCTYGIHLKWYNGHNVEGNFIYENEYGIYLDDVSNSTFTSNELNDNKYAGIYFKNQWCKDNHFTNNMLIGNGVEIYTGITYNEMISYEPIDSSNTLNSRPIYFYVNETGFGASMFTNAGQILLINCNDSLISNANTSYSTHGISLYYCNNITMTGCDISNNKKDGLNILYGGYNKLLYCTVNNNGLGTGGIGIAIDESAYTYLYNNTITNNVQEGIQLSQSNHSSIINNIVKNNGIYSGEGIALSYTGYCEVIGNIINENNNNIGIMVDGSYCNITNNVANGNLYGFSIEGIYNNISGNTANYNTDDGFGIHRDHNELTNNVANVNGYDGFYFQQSNFHSIINNSASNNGWSGFHFSDSNNITILDNTAMFHVWQGIEIENSENYTIINNDLLNNEDGIELTNCEDIRISNNEIHGYNGVLGWDLNHSIIKENNFDDNNHSAVAIIDSEDTLIMDNKMNNCGDAFYSRNSFDCIITDNEINYNEERGLWIYLCDDIEILNNNASFNEYGLWVSESTNLLVSDNAFNNNSDYGIIFWNATDSEITSNTINGNEKDAIYLYAESNFNTISDNIMIWNNRCIYVENSTGNIFSNNVCHNRPQSPPSNGHGDRPPIPGYDIFLLTIVSLTLMIYLLKKQKSKIRD